MKSVANIPYYHFALRYVLLIGMLFYFSFNSVGQKIPPPKIISPALRASIKTLPKNELREFVVVVTNKEAFLRAAANQDPDIYITAEYPAAGILIIKTTCAALQIIITNGHVLFVDLKRVPVEELVVSSYDLGTNRVNKVHHQYPQWNGNGLGLSVKENKLDTTDIDFKGRYFYAPQSSTIYSPHAGIMATIAAGAGNSFYQGKGAAWGASIASSSFATLLPDPDAAYTQYNISVQNHSYGTGIENFYGADARAYDMSANNNPGLLHVFSGGNSGTQTSSTGAYTGIPGYANITGSFKMAKNILTVGHTDSSGNPLLPSSRGPAYDGRIKPDLVAYGEDGSSGAAALVSGISLVLQQSLKELNANTMPSAALVKAILITSADDVGPAGIDYVSGYGAVNASKAIKIAVNGNYTGSSVLQNQLREFPLTIPPASSQIKISLAWNDPAAAANANKALINNLDLELYNPSTGETWLPFVLSSFPHIDSLVAAPGRKRDSLNNTEQVVLANPPAGNYIIRVRGYQVLTAGQSFAIAWQIQTDNNFEWDYPTGSDNILPASSNKIRWSSSYASGVGELSYTIDGTNWLNIASVPLTTRFFQWNAPTLPSLAKLRMRIGATEIISDTFTISTPLQTGIGFNCADSFSFFWNRENLVTQYQLYRLGPKYLEPLQVVTDTMIVLSKSANPSLHYTVAPIIGNKAGIKAYTFNYTTQGVECYTKSFLVTLNSNSASLLLELGTIYQVQQLTWEKLTSNGYVALQNVVSISGLLYNYNDTQLKSGSNTYRVKITLRNGQVIYTQPETVYYFTTQNHIIYPNPARTNAPITIISKEVNNDLLQVFNSNGIKVMELVLDDVVKTIAPDKLLPGLYVGLISNSGERRAAIKFIVR